MDEEPQTMSREAAAAYLSVKGWRGQKTTLAKYAVEGTGPPFTKAPDGRTTVYSKADLDTWLAAGGQNMRGLGGRPSHRRRGPSANPLLDELSEFLPMVERIARGSGTFQDGVNFAQALERLKAVVRQRRNGTQ